MYTVHDFIKHERAYKRIGLLVNDYIYIKTKEKDQKK